MAVNDEDVLTTFRDGLAPMRMDVPADAIVTRGRWLRRRKRGGLLAGGALAIALGAGLSVPALTSAGPEQTTLAAWTVHQQSDGSIAVTIRQLRDLPALQTRLTDDGARVAISDTTVTLPHGCVTTRPLSGLLTYNKDQLAHGLVVVIRPSLIPGDQLLQILLVPGPPRSLPTVTQQNGKVTVYGGPVKSTAAPGLFVTLVKNSAECTG